MGCEPGGRKLASVTIVLNVLRCNCCAAKTQAPVMAFSQFASLSRFAPCQASRPVCSDPAIDACRFALAGNLHKERDGRVGMPIAILPPTRMLTGPSGQATTRTKGEDARLRRSKSGTRRLMSIPEGIDTRRAPDAPTVIPRPLPISSVWSRKRPGGCPHDADKQCPRAG